MFKRTIVTGLVATGLMLTGQAAFAGGKHGNHYDGDRYDREDGYDYARVVDVDPIMRRVRVETPRRECYQETRYDYDDRAPRRYEARQDRAGPMILGGIIGAAIGNQIGRGDGRRAATVAGAIIGSAIGHDAGNRRPVRDERYGYESRESREYTVERCDTRMEESWEERIDGYRVTYMYNGRRGVTQLPYDPGERIRVRVDVRPADDC